jgi:septal ring factor EnvC (AmiA/AmiB activator)
MVIVQHGAYYTVYSGLASIGVKTGQMVVAGQELGLVPKNTEKKKPTFNFQVWRTKGEGRVKLNPEEWLKG